MSLYNSFFFNLSILQECFKLKANLIPALEPFKVRELVHVAVLEEVAVPVVVLSLPETLGLVAGALAAARSALSPRFPAFPPTLATLLVKDSFG